MRARVMRWLWRDDRPEWADRVIDPLIGPVSRLLCLAYGHMPERDQCGRPEHDFCLWCNKRMPGAAR